MPTPDATATRDRLQIADLEGRLDAHKTSYQWATSRLTEAQSSLQAWSRVARYHADRVDTLAAQLDAARTELGKEP